MTEDALICRRIDAALALMASEGMSVRAIYLTERDRDALGRAFARGFGRGFKLHPCAYRDHHVRDGKKSIIYSTHGVGRSIRSRLPKDAD